MDIPKVDISIKGVEAELSKELSSREVVAIYNEFDYKVKYSFKRFVFLSPTKGDIVLDDLLNQILQTEGYEAHKISCHQDKASHIHVKYYEEWNARAAVELFKHPHNIGEIKVSAILLYDFLLSLYATECLCRRFPAWTLTVVDIVGLVEHCQPLSKDEVKNLLYKFGDPRIFVYNVDHAAPSHVQALFSSMAEALGASIAHGPWMRRHVPESPKFCYRIRLIGSEKESELMRRFSSSNDVERIFQMDYFVINNLAELNARPVQNYPIKEHVPSYPNNERYIQPQHVQFRRGDRHFNSSYGNHSRRGHSRRGGRNYYDRNFPRQPRNQTPAVPDKSDSAVTTEN